MRLAIAEAVGVERRCPPMSLKHRSDRTVNALQEVRNGQLPNLGRSTGVSVSLPQERLLQAERMRIQRLEQPG
jgi:hypothetical protein